MIIRYIQATKTDTAVAVDSQNITGSDKKLVVVDITCTPALPPDPNNLYPLYHLSPGGKILAIQNIEMFSFNATIPNSKVQFYIDQGHTIKIGIDETVLALPENTRFVLTLIIGA
jgi:hypothetical protein